MPRLRERRRLNRNTNSSMYAGKWATSVDPWWVPSSHRLINEATRCTAGSSSLGSCPRARAARWLRRSWTYPSCSIEELTDDDITACTEALAAAPSLTTTVRGHNTARLFGLHHACYQLRICHTPPRIARQPAATIEQMLTAGVPQVEIRQVALRYLALVATTLRPSTRPLPRALAPDHDRDLMAAVDGLTDQFARHGLTILRGTGLRLGELLDLELDCAVDFASHGSWLKVPLGKLGTERTVPLDEATLVALDGWTAQRDTQRALPHPRHGKPTDFLFVERGRQLSAYRLRQGLADAASVAGLRGPDGTVLHVTPHQLRHIVPAL